MPAAPETSDSAPTSTLEPAVNESTPSTDEPRSKATAVAPYEPQGDEPRDSDRASFESAEERAGVEKDNAEEHASRKRERETSLEPSAHPSPSTNGPIDSLPLKKNRVQADSGTLAGSSTRPENLEEEQEPSDDLTELGRKATAETEKVGQIRQKVQDLTWKEGQDGDALGKTKESPAASAATDSASQTLTSSAKNARLEAKPGPDEKAVPVRTQPTFSSFSAKASPFSSVPTSSGSSSSSANGGFALSSSPFKNFAKGNVSPFAVAGGVKPSSLGSSIGGHNGVDATSGSSKSTATSTAPAGPNLGFGAFAGASPLTKAKTPSANKEEQDPAASAEGAEASSAGQGKSFGERLLSDAPPSTVQADRKPTLDAAEHEVITGEEDEASVYSVRAKLYTMGEGQSWKERGTGTIRINVPKERGGRHSARLVMRTDGILRLILNVSLFTGMKCELQEKFVRIVAFEDGQLAHFAIKLSNPTNAAAFMDAVQKQIGKLEK